MTAFTPIVVVVVWLADIAAATAYNSIETFPPVKRTLNVTKAGKNDNSSVGRQLKSQEVEEAGRSHTAASFN
ncbi:hypothetical protein Pmani_013128 [Petrolisthes manimaculis]|uniref:Secreted protein n=1 Tax=Petrolisthes manimaculis TaxID=1843537 RepID=A0AAE1PZ47_9EUCA|nr:hypothetical protein Pmani_013128 [Petrolisthes manimaculis]